MRSRWKWVTMPTPNKNPCPGHCVCVCCLGVCVCVSQQFPFGRHEKAYSSGLLIFATARHGRLVFSCYFRQFLFHSVHRWSLLLTKAKPVKSWTFHRNATFSNFPLVARWKSSLFFGPNNRRYKSPAVESDRFFPNYILGEIWLSTRPHLAFTFCNRPAANSHDFLLSHQFGLTFRPSHTFPLAHRWCMNIFLI